MVGWELRSPPLSSPPGLPERSPREPGLGPTTAIPRLPPSVGFSAALGLAPLSCSIFCFPSFSLFRSFLPHLAPFLLLPGRE